MAFGQPSGPSATAKQVRDLLELLQAAGHTDFRDARGPMGFTQRQAAGRFTRDEAQSFIEQLEREGEREHDTPGPLPTPRPGRLTTGDATLRRISAEDLAAELQRRGWIVMEP